jgi:glycine/D-amino acid oxidase-like deaminating enzyme
MPPIERRELLQNAAVLSGLNLLGACARQSQSVPPLAPVRASPDRIFDVTVCLRPFRAAGPRLDTEQIGDTFVVHNYGHGGSGWSLSWGSGAVAVQKAMASSPRQIAVIGCGAIGLTSAILAQRAGAQVTIYARELMPQTRSARATGTWSPDSRIALTSAAPPGFPALWEQMARTSFKAYRAYLGLPGDPVEWNDRYILSDKTRAEAAATAPADPLGFANYSDRIGDLTPDIEDLPPGSTPFPVRYVRRYSSMMFNIADYGHTLLNDFLLAGGKIRIMEFHEPGELAGLPEKTIINCPGYGGRALWRDNSIVPVRGQLAWLMPQAEVNYGLSYRDIAMLSRRDGILVQDFAGGDMRGYSDDNEMPDRREALAAVGQLAEVYQGRASF